MDEGGRLVVALVVVVAIVGYFGYKHFSGSDKWSQSDVTKWCDEAPREWSHFLGHASDGDINLIETGLTTYATVTCASAWNSYVAAHQYVAPITNHGLPAVTVP